MIPSHLSRTIGAKARLFQAYLRYFRRARTLHDLHAPAVYALARAVVDPPGSGPRVFRHIEQLRTRLKRNTSTLRNYRFGAGSPFITSATTTVGRIARYAPVRPATGRMLHRCAGHIAPEYVLEMGANLGISTLYLASAAPGARIYTLEGNPDLAALARRHFSEFGYDHIQCREGNFRDTLPELLDDLPRLDLAFIDGDHRYAATLEYAGQCLQKLSPGGVLIIGDIHWSAGMERAWRELRELPEVRLSVDLFETGLLFIDPQIRHRQHYTLIPSRWKPWRLGLFG